MKTIVAVGQMTSTENKKENLEKVLCIIENAAKLGAKFVGLPENFAFMGAADGASVQAAEPLDGPTIKMLRKTAEHFGVWLSLGGFQEKVRGKEKIYNTHIVVDDRGDIVAIYRKIHLFSVTLPDGEVYDEARSILGGEEIITVKTPFFTAGLSICYDLRFPGIYAGLRDRGAEILLVPAAFTAYTGVAHWEILLRARAIETQSYVFAPAQIGHHNEKRETYGHAMIVDPWGTVLAECEENCEIALAEIDLAFLQKLRNDMPVWKHRRIPHDVYIQR